MSQSEQNNYGGTNYQIETGTDNTNFFAEIINNYYQQAVQPIENAIPFNVPFLRNPYFTGRDEFLTQLHEALQQRRAVALSGLGGIGKTQTAVEYAYRSFENRSYQWVFWVRADTELALSTDFGDLARVLALPQQQAQETEQKIEAVKRWFAHHTNWLLIFDNADRPELLQNFRPQNPQGCILVTSRAPVLDAAGIAEVKQVLKLARQESIAMLMKRTGQEPGTDAGGTAAERLAAEKLAAERLALEFDDLPLALEQAGAFIRERQIRIQDYWTSYQRQRFKLLELHPAGVNYPASVTTTWAINFQAVQEENPAAADVLQLSALLSADAIPYELLVKGAKHLSDRIQTALAEAETDPILLANLLHPLARYSLIQPEPVAQSYSIHRMVQAVVRHGMTDDQLQDWVNRTIAALNAAFPKVDYDKWTHCARLLPQVEAIQPYLPDELEEAEALAELLNQAGLYLDQRGQYAEAEPLYLRSLEIREAQSGKDHPDVATSLNNLALLYDNQGRYPEAEPLYLRSLEIWEAQLGKDHPDVALSLNNLAGLYWNQGRYPEAEPLYLRSLEIREAQLGKDHPDVALSLNNLALLYDNQGRYPEAEPLYLRSLEIWEAQLGKDHPHVANSLNNLAGLYYSQGRYPEAEPLYLRSLEIREAQLGKDHPDVAISLNNLALLYNNQGRYPEAEPLYLRSLEIWEAQLGKDHPHVAASLNGLAKLYNNQGRYNEAEPLYDRAISILEQRLGVNHPNTVKCRGNLQQLKQKLSESLQPKPESSGAGTG